VADKKITELPENTTPATEDLVAQVDDPSGTPATKKATLNNILKLIPTGLSTNTAPVTSDTMWIVDDPGGTPTKEEITLENLFKVVNEFTADASPSSSDIIPVIVDPGGTTLVSKVTIANLGTGGGVTGMGSLTDGATIAWDLDYGNGSVTLGTIGGSTRVLGNPTNGLAGHHYNLLVTQGTVGGRQLTYDTSYLFPHGAKPPLSTVTNQVDILEFFWDGTNMHLTDTKNNLAATFDPETSVSSATLLCWLDANQITGKSDGDTITGWTDSCQLGTDHSLTTSGSPTYQTNEINGYPCVRFIGSQAGTFAPGPWANTEGWTYILVAAPYGSSSATRGLSGSVNWLWSMNRSENWHGVHRVTGWSSGITPAVADGVWHITLFQNSDGASFLHRVDAVDKDTSGVTGSGPGNLFIGPYSGASSAEDSDHYIAELLIYDGNLSSGDKTAVENYLNGKYSIY
jgi:hypothetical protein